MVHPDLISSSIFEATQRLVYNIDNSAMEGHKKTGSYGCTYLCLLTNKLASWPCPVAGTSHVAIKVSKGNIGSYSAGFTLRNWVI